MDLILPARSIESENGTKTFGRPETAFGEETALGAGNVIDVISYREGE